MKRLKEKFLIRLKKRFQPGTTSILGFPLGFVDKSSFLSMYEEIFEKDVYYFPSANKKPRIIDCGSNIGLSILYFKRLFPESEILAFEPDPKIFEVLKRNIEQAHVSGVELVHACLSDKPGKVPFFCEGADGGKIAHGGHAGNTTMVQAVTLDTYIDRHIDFLKIDIEGAEFDVLENIKHTLHYVERLFVEYHSHENQPQRLSEILAILREHGFRYYMQSVGVRSKKPFEKIDTYLGLDLQMNIFAYRN